MRRYLLAAAPLLLTLLFGALLWRAAWTPDGRVERLAAPYRYNLARWELQHLPGRWLYALGSALPWREAPSAGRRSAAVERYFALNRQIRELEAAPAGPAADPSGRVEALRAERDALENTVEAELEARLTAVLREQGLVERAPLFHGWRLPWPPVDFEFDATPSVLAVSPRERIELSRTVLLAGGMRVEDAEALERAVEAGGVSALVVPTGGVATYPAVIPAGADYARAVEAMAHEWVHQYLFFHPLGFRYFQDPELATLNETVATIAGEDLAALVLARYPVPGEPSAPRRREAPGPMVGERDFRSVMAELRRRVDALLAEGRVAEAEAEMERTRAELAAHGVFIRRINQAYFAFYGTYATLPQSADPAGPRLRALRDAVPSVGEFLRLAAEIRSGEDLLRLLAERGVTPP
ncbi:MAG TPA: hypothetical protein VIO14_14530 [Dehalococcoidia bacterium]